MSWGGFAGIGSKIGAAAGEATAQAAAKKAEEDFKALLLLRLQGLQDAQARQSFELMGMANRMGSQAGGNSGAPKWSVGSLTGGQAGFQLGQDRDGPVGGLAGFAQRAAQGAASGADPWSGAGTADRQQDVGQLRSSWASRLGRSLGSARGRFGR